MIGIYAFNGRTIFIVILCYWANWANKPNRANNNYLNR